MPITKCTHAFLLPARNVLAGPGFALIVCVVLAFGTQSPAQSFTDLYDFQGTSDGFSPNVPIAGPDGAIYATTLSGGNLNCAGGFGGCGTVFRLAPTTNGRWEFSALYDFQGGKDGYGYTTLTLDGQGNLYGSTVGSSFYGGVFRLTPGAPGKRWHFTSLYEFTGQSDGANPQFPLFIDGSGAIYGVSSTGGLHGPGCDQQFGCGAVFQLVPPKRDGGPYTVNVLYEFQGEKDGGTPTGMMMDNSGTIYGTTAYGGKFNKNCALGCGLIFQLSPLNGTWTYKVLHSFNGSNHQSPASPLIEDASGNLYGLVGVDLYGAGDIFQLSPPASGTGRWKLTYIKYFDNNYPATNLILGPNGTLYGDIYGDQDLNWGYVFEMTPPLQAGEKWGYKPLVNLNGTPYQNPAGIVVGLNGDLYTTISGGTYWPGNILSVVP